MTPKERMAKARAARFAGTANPHKISIKNKEIFGKDRLRHIPPVFHNLFIAVWNGTKSRTARIKAKCIDCCCYQKSEVRNCSAVYCPLHPIRPYQK